MLVHTRTAGGGHGEPRPSSSTPAGRRARLGAAALLGLAALALALPSSGGYLRQDALQAAFGTGGGTAAGAGRGAAASRGRLASSPPPLPTGRIIGTNDGAGWGPRAARTILRGQITWDRVELHGPFDTVRHSLNAGFKVLAIVNNPLDQAPLSVIDPSVWGAGVVSELQANPGVSIAEAANEAYLKGGIADPVQYGRMYLAAVEDMRAAGIGIPLLFNMTGDIPLGSWADPGVWSEDANGGGWLRDAVNGVPGLAAAILANGIAIHPYGAVGHNSRDEWGVAAAAAEERVAGAVLGSIPPFYVTEIGYDLDRCGEGLGACSEGEQASKLRAAFRALFADPHVRGVWWYQSHDDSTGHYGFMNVSNTTRPSFTALSAIARSVGQ
ncbi:MAG TPA: hypothetical protein VK756_09330 [Solirubrobacteraceae bacterium]|nr:hypothetical protein [Solirubrobacteraceae bacterium]